MMVAIAHLLAITKAMNFLKLIENLKRHIETRVGQPYKPQLLHLRRPLHSHCLFFLFFLSIAFKKGSISSIIHYARLVLHCFEKLWSIVAFNDLENVRKRSPQSR